MTRFFFRKGVCLVIIMINGLLIPGVMAEINKNRLNLPPSVGQWTRSEKARIIDSGSIFDYMNGAGELYLAYGFDHLRVYEYTAEDQENILVEVYVMSASEDAFGLLSMDWGGDPVVIHPEGPSPGGRRVSPPVRALYGKGLLRIWADTLFVRVMAYRETKESKEAVLSIGRSISMNRASPSEPKLLKTLPDSGLPGWTLRNDRIGFFRSHLVLNSLYYLGHQNILLLDQTTEAVTAPYEMKTDTGVVKRVQVIVVRYAEPDKAQKALEHFHEAYLTEYPKPNTRVSGRQVEKAFKIEDGWVAYSQDERLLCIVLECPTKEEALAWVKQIFHNRNQ